MRRLAPFALVLSLLGTAAVAEPHQVKAGDLVIAARTVRASIGHLPTTAAYMTIANTGSAPDRLMSASCACADRVEVHVMQEMKGMMMMNDAGPVVIPPHGQVSFHPGGRHLMLTGLKEQLLDGGQQEITLVFERAGRVTASFNIRAKIAADGSPPEK
jgi:copper(I)-binding protein